MTYGRGEDIGGPNFDKEVSHNHIPLLTNGTEVNQYILQSYFSFLTRNEY